MMDLPSNKNNNGLIIVCADENNLVDKIPSASHGKKPGTNQEDYSLFSSLEEISPKVRDIHENLREKKSGSDSFVTPGSQSNFIEIDPKKGSIEDSLNQVPPILREQLFSKNLCESLTLVVFSEEKNFISTLSKEIISYLEKKHRVKVFHLHLGKNEGRTRLSKKKTDFTSNTAYNSRFSKETSKSLVKSENSSPLHQSGENHTSKGHNRRK